MGCIVFQDLGGKIFQRPATFKTPDGNGRIMTEIMKTGWESPMRIQVAQGSCSVVVHHIISFKPLGSLELDNNEKLHVSF
jgi:hypothetical protein